MPPTFTRTGNGFEVRRGEVHRYRDGHVGVIINGEPEMPVFWLDRVFVSHVDDSLKQERTPARIKVEFGEE